MIDHRFGLEAGTSHRFRRTTTTLAVLVALMLTLPAVAAAQQSSVAGYGPKDSDVLGEASVGAPNGTGSDGTGSTANSSSSGGLPFTGLDMGLMVGGAVVLIVAGAALARAVTSQPQELS